MTDTLTVKEETNPKASGGKFTCPMHTEIVRDAVCACPICGMNLVPMQPTDIEKKRNILTLFPWLVTKCLQFIGSNPVLQTQIPCGLPNF